MRSRNDAFRDVDWNTVPAPLQQIVEACLNDGVLQDKVRSMENGLCKYDIVALVNAGRLVRVIVRETS